MNLLDVLLWVFSESFSALHVGWLALPTLHAVDTDIARSVEGGHEGVALLPTTRECHIFPGTSSSEYVWPDSLLFLRTRGHLTITLLSQITYVWEDDSTGA